MDQRFCKNRFKSASVLPEPTQQQNNSGGVEGSCCSLSQNRGWIPQGQNTPETDLTAAEHPTPLK